MMDDISIDSSSSGSSGSSEDENLEYGDDISVSSDDNDLLPPAGYNAGATQATV